MQSRLPQGREGRSAECTVLVVTHPVPRPYFDFHVAEIFIDDKLNIPVRYAAYTWPAQAGGGGNCWKSTPIATSDQSETSPLLILIPKRILQLLSSSFDS